LEVLMKKTLIMRLNLMILWQLLFLKMVLLNHKNLLLKTWKNKLEMKVALY
jgi:hypothetical protein